MVRIIGNIKPEYDCTHQPGPEENFNESVYFNFFDRERVGYGLSEYLNQSDEENT